MQVTDRAIEARGDAHEAEDAALERAARLLRGAAALGIGAMAFGVVALILFLAFQAATRGKGAIAYTLSPGTAYLLLLVVLVCWCIWVVAAGRKRTVLFLRKFGNEAANATIADAIRLSLRHRARLFVLDDSRFPSVGVSRRDRLLSLAWVAPFVLSVLLAVFLLNGTKGSFSGTDTQENFATGRRSDVAATAAGSAPTEFIDSNPLFTWPYAPFLWALLAILCVPVVAGAVAASRGRWHLRNSRDVARLLGTVAYAGSWIGAPRVMSPMMFLANTDDAVWREAVTGLIQRCDLVVLDLSVQTVHMQWELETCRSIAPGKLLLVAPEDDPAADPAGDADADKDLQAWRAQAALRYPARPAEASKVLQDYLREHRLLSAIGALRD